MEEIFLPVPDYEGIYEISNFGRVKTLEREYGYINKKGKQVNYKLPENFLKPYITNKGYLKVDLYKEGQRQKLYVHRLVAIAFIPNPEDKPQVNHKDGDRTNANVNNLEWMNNSENNKHAFEVLGRKIWNAK